MIVGKHANTAEKKIFNLRNIINNNKGNLNIGYLDLYSFFIVLFSFTLIIYILFLTKQIHNLNSQIILIQKQSMYFYNHVNELIEINRQVQSEISEILKDKELFFKYVVKTNENLTSKYNAFENYHNSLELLFVAGIAICLCYSGYYFIHIII
jgi:regulator of replication initiation timing